MAEDCLEGLLEHVRCPRSLLRDGRSIRLARQGDVLADACGHRYPIIDGVPDLRPIDETDRTRDADNYATVHDVQKRVLRSSFMDETLERTASYYGLDMGDVNGRRILVVGSALGQEVSIFLAFKAETVIGIDYSSFVRSLRSHHEFERTQVHLLQGDALALPFDDKYFDIVFSSGVLQHTRSPEVGFREMYRVTKPTGMLNLSVAYPESAIHRNITRVRLKRQFHKMPAAEAKARLRKALRRRLLLEKLKLARLDYRMTDGMAFPGMGLSFEERFGIALDTYFPPYRHSIHPREIRTWFTDLGMKPRLPKNFSRFFEDADANEFGAPKSFIAFRPTT